MEQYLLVFMRLRAYISTESMFTIYSASYLICRNACNYGATILGEECVSNASILIVSILIQKLIPLSKQTAVKLYFNIL